MGPEGVLIGDSYTSNWRSNGFVGSSKRNWNAAGDTFNFVWSTQNGDQLIGDLRDSPTNTL